MASHKILSIYENSTEIQRLSEYLQSSDTVKCHLKNVNASFLAVCASVLQGKSSNNHVFVVNDREEAVYLQNDINNLLQADRALLFPASYKKAFRFEEIDNANVLQRTEVLNSITENQEVGTIVITYPEALPEKVISRQSLVSNTFHVKVGEKLDTEFLTEFLIEYGFEKNDFVYEAGSFAVRGGIIDVFSFSNNLPFRIELLGREVESIRTFDPENQLSKEDKKKISIVPDLQTRVTLEKRFSFFDYLPENTVFWVKDCSYLFEIANKYYEKVVDAFELILKTTNGTAIVKEPSELFDDEEAMRSQLLRKKIVEIGTVSNFGSQNIIDFQIQSQPSFNKEFKLLAQDLNQKQAEGYETFILSDSFHQLQKIHEILAEMDSTLKVQEITTSLRYGFVDKNEKVLFYTDHELFERYYKYKTAQKYSKSRAITLNELKNLNPGDYVTHIDHGVGRFAGLTKTEVNGINQEQIRIVYKDDDVLYVNVHSLHKISRHSGKDGAIPSISKLGSPEWENKKSKVKKKVKEIAIDLIALYAKRKQNVGYAFEKDGFLQAELETSFIYEDTPDQAKATAEVKIDMESPHPMDRLVCGDVGFGKTEVAIRAAFKAAVDGKQVAVLVPTTVLALQHYKTFKQRLEQMPITVDYMNRFRSAKEIKETTQALAEGKVDILIGTHKIVGKSIKFKDLGLLIIDEEQKFGVAVKDKLKELKSNVDVLTLTATPIPRTLQFSLMGARDLSVITTPPPNRQPVTTEVHNFNEEVVRDAVSFELNRGGQVFFVHNRIKDIEGIANIIMRLVPDAKVGIAHGQMEGKQLEKEMLKFIEHEYDVLVSTNIIESGLDIPNANTMIINHAHMYGMSDLHQMRGRVGRSNKKAFCYLLTLHLGSLTSDARKRLSTLEEFSELGDGFKISMRDLDIRGAGDILGGEQSGFVNDIGMEAYQQILAEAVQELKENEFKDFFKTDIDISALKVDCNIELGVEVLIPEEYVSNITERLRLYNHLDNIKKESELEAFVKEIDDRFGPVPESVQNLVQSVYLRWEAEKLGFERLRLKEGVLKAFVTIEGNESYFQSPIFGRILGFVQKDPQRYSFKEVKGRMILTFKNVKKVEEATAVLRKILVANE